MLLCVKDTPWGARAQQACPDARVIMGLPDRPVDDDVILSFCSPWIVPREVLERTRLAVNFHPAPPDHPGFAPYNWALYHKDPSYGVTVHHMAPRVDTGAIIDVVRFPILRTDTVWTLQQRTMEHLLTAFVAFLQCLPVVATSGERWRRAPRTRADFEALRRLDPGMSDMEIGARVRACHYPGHEGAYFPQDGAAFCT